MQTIEEQLLSHEGFESKVYRCPAGKLTVGVGRNLEDKGITKEEALYLLKNDIQECVADLRNLFTDFDRLQEPQKNALIDLRFNIGPNRFRTFKKMIAAVDDRDFILAAKEMKDSRWYHQVGDRAKTLCAMIQS
jgi:lysozyme